jgi:hypothetical protein
VVRPRDSPYFGAEGAPTPVGSVRFVRQ